MLKTSISRAEDSTSVGCGGAGLASRTNGGAFGFFIFCLLPVSQHLFLCKSHNMKHLKRAHPYNNKQLKGKTESLLQ